MTTTINDILISELDRAVVPATAEDELVINQADGSGNFVTRRISWGEVGQSIKDLSGSIDRPDLDNQILFADGTEPAPSITFKNDPSTGLYRPILTIPALGISAGGYEVLRIAHDVSPGQGRVGIGFQINDPGIPLDALHVKSGGILVDYGAGLNFRITNDTSSVIDDSSKTESNIRLGTLLPNNLKLQTNGKERVRVTKDGKLLIHGAIGVNGYAGENVINPDYGEPGNANESGSILISQGESRSTIWMRPGQFFDQNTSVITDILINSPDFIQDITDNINIDLIIDDIINDIDFIEGIINEINLELDFNEINDGLEKINTGDGVEVSTRVVGSPPVNEKYLRADNTIARGTYDGTKNTSISSDAFVGGTITGTEVTGSTEVFFYNISPLP